MTNSGAELKALKEMVSRFAREEVAPRGDLRNLVIFPPDLHEAMEKQGLFAIGVPRESGGAGGGWLHMAVAAQALVEHGRSLGTALSWLMHVLISRFVILGYGTDGQKGDCLPLLASGKMVPCLAISEPGVGGHPGKLTTTARRKGGSFVLSGEKAYLTNGPMATLYAVLAVTAEEGGRKSYTAFLVPAEARGLERTAPMDLGFLRPCPHGGIILEGCRVPAECVIGREGRAYTDIALPFRQVEDVMMTAPFIGGARAQVGMIASALRERGTDPGRDVASALGWAAAALESLEILSREGARMLDEGGAGHPGLLSLALYLRQAASDVQERLSAITGLAGLEMGHDYASLANDLVSSMKIAGNVARIRQEKLGRSLCS